jgi:hypothetical protein
MNSPFSDDDEVEFIRIPKSGVNALLSRPIAVDFINHKEK